MDSNRKTLYLLLAICAFPFLGAWLYYYNAPALVTKTTNRGILIRPPVNINKWPLQNALMGGPLEFSPAMKKWTLLYVKPGPCGEGCKDNIFAIRQIRKAMGKEQGRVRSLFLTTKNQVTPTLTLFMKTQYQNTKFTYLDKPTLLNNLQPVVAKHSALKPEGIFIVDPLGNLMMAYPLNQEPKGIIKDLTHLLKISSIG